MDYKQSNSIAVRFHCSSRLHRSGKQAKHPIFNQCQSVMKVLALNPQYGLAIPSFHKLRKMRVAVPESRLGKSGGYRLIYSQRVVDEILYVLLLDLYFKGDKADLDRSDYKSLLNECDLVFSKPLSYHWEDPPEKELAKNQTYVAENGGRIAMRTVA